MTLALKYRPKTFSEVIGQEAIIKTLTNALDTKNLASAYLFSGLRGSGKTTTARIFAKALQCSQGESSTPCEVCDNCKMANENRHIDIIEMDGASNRKIEDIKEIIEQTKYKPTIGRYKIFIIDEAHMLTREAENALLKTLEEPPEYVKFILATTDPLKLPATILSRVQHYRFTKIDTMLIKTHLEYILAKENVSFDTKAVELLAKSGEGSLRDTITLLEQAIAYSKGKLSLDQVVDMLGVINPEMVDRIFDLIFKEDKKAISTITKEIASYDIDTILDEIISYLKAALFQNKFSIITIERFFKIVADVKELIKINVDNEFVLSLMFFKMIEALKPHKIDDLIREFEKKAFHVTTPSTQPSSPPQPLPPTTDLFSKLKQELLNRDKELYECFKDVEFVSFQDNVLVWESCVNDECKQLLRKYWSSVIKILIDEIFGIGTKVTPKPCSKLAPQPKPQKSTPVEIVEHDKNIVKKAHEIFGDDIVEVNIYRNAPNS
ncbi:MAG: DNA polymerase III subunit gamma/tau [Epsilonproteobacteria bacterium]|nr:DNA polymerase III subunit gamma/tau [Campylobacterota bacterium]